MTDQDSVEANKAASAAGAVNNSEVGVDGDDPSVADVKAAQTNSGGQGQPDPVTGSTSKATGKKQAAENEQHDSAS